MFYPHVQQILYSMTTGSCLKYSGKGVAKKITKGIFAGMMMISCPTKSKRDAISYYRRSL